MKQISLTQSKYALVDDEDYEYLNQFKWHAAKRKKKWYARGDIDGKKQYMHRILLGSNNDYETDHEDGDGLNNQRYNLRMSTNTQNNYNKDKHKDNFSGYKGVYFDKRPLVKPWRAQIQVNKKPKKLGYYATAVEAAMAYDQAAKELHGEFARLNFKEMSA